MSQRMSYKRVSPSVFQAMLDLENKVNSSGLDPALLDLARLRASQINGCSSCLDMHARDLRQRGEPEQRLDVLPAWREVSIYTDRERAALAWTEAVTLVADGHVADDVYDEALRQFTERELAELTLAVVAINGWNRFNVAFRTPPTKC